MRRLPRLLVINPNTSTGVSQVIDALVREEVADAAQVQTVTAEFGFSYISTRVAVTIAAHAVLDAAAKALAEGAKPDVIVLACFGDPGREALAEMTGLPVIGFAEAGLLAAAALPGTSLVSTNGTVWCEMLGELALKLGIGDRIAGIRSIEAVADDAQSIASFLAKEAKALGAERVVLGGAGLIPILPAVIATAGVPILDPHRIGIGKALCLAANPQPATAVAPAAMTDTLGLSPFLAQALSASSNSTAAGADRS